MHGSVDSNLSWNVTKFDAWDYHSLFEMCLQIAPFFSSFNNTNKERNKCIDMLTNQAASFNRARVNRVIIIRSEFDVNILLESNYRIQIN